MDYSQTKDIINSVSILSKEDAEFIEQNIGEIQHNWEKKQRWRTETEMRISVLDDTRHATLASKYWQCVREQSGFYENLVQDSFEFRRNELAIAKLQDQISREEANTCPPPGQEFKVEELKIDLDECLYKRIHLIANAKDRVRELRLWSQLMGELTAADPNFDTEDVNSHQHISYLWRWHNQLKGMDLANISISEINNLTAQYVTGLHAAFARGWTLPEPIMEDAKQLAKKFPTLNRVAKQNAKKPLAAAVHNLKLE